MTTIVQRFLFASVRAVVCRQTVVVSQNQLTHQHFPFVKNHLSIQSKCFGIWSQNLRNQQQHRTTMSASNDTNSDKPKVIFVLGAPGSGKGTQCANIVSQYNYVHLSAGDLLRAERNRPGSEMAQTIEEYIRGGKIIPVAVTCSLIERAMNEEMQVRSWMFFSHFVGLEFRGNEKISFV